MSDRREQAAHMAMLASVDPSTIRVAEYVGNVAVFEGRTPDGKVIAAAIPRLRPGAPYLMQTAWIARANGLITGRCRLCDCVATVTERGVQFTHHLACPAGSAELEAWVMDA